MNGLDQLASLLSTDASFRQAFLADPEAALTAYGLALDAEIKAAATRVRGILAASPQDLLLQVRSYGPTDWGIFSLDRAVLAPAPG